MSRQLKTNLNLSPNSHGVDFPPLQRGAGGIYDGGGYSPAQIPLNPPFSKGEAIPTSVNDEAAGQSVSNPGNDGVRWLRPAAWPRLDIAAVHVWRIYLPNVLPRLAHIGDVLTAEEYAHARAILSPRDRSQFLAGRTALRVVLSGYLGIGASEIVFEYGPHGKPALAPDCRRNGITFNLSHSHDWIVCAIARGRAVGVDVEYRRPGVDFGAMAERVLSTLERRALHKLPLREQEKLFFDTWARKEAYVKALGQGVFYPFANMALAVGAGLSPRLLDAPAESHPARWSFNDLPIGADYAAALAVDGPAPALSLWEWCGSLLPTTCLSEYRTAATCISPRDVAPRALEFRRSIRPN